MAGGDHHGSQRRPNGPKQLQDEPAARDAVAFDDTDPEETITPLRRRWRRRAVRQLGYVHGRCDHSRILHRRQNMNRGR
jgi:hypothetical protein